jgi:hypothetical protein
MSNSVKTVLSGTFAGTSLTPKKKSMKEMIASGIAFIFIGCVMLVVDAPTISPAVQVACGSFFILLGIGWLILLHVNKPKPLTAEQEERCNQVYAEMVEQMKKDEAILMKVKEQPDALPILKKVKIMLEEELRNK